jgi:hypothetical protein
MGLGRGCPCPNPIQMPRQTQHLRPIISSFDEISSCSTIIYFAGNRCQAPPKRHWMACCCLVSQVYKGQHRMCMLFCIALYMLLTEIKCPLEAALASSRMQSARARVTSLFTISEQVLHFGTTRLENDILAVLNSKEHEPWSVKKPKICAVPKRTRQGHRLHPLGKIMNPRLAYFLPAIAI